MPQRRIDRQHRVTDRGLLWHIARETGADSAAVVPEGCKAWYFGNKIQDRAWVTMRNIFWRVIGLMMGSRFGSRWSRGCLWL
jgi:hypothetical protein